MLVAPAATLGEDYVRRVAIEKAMSQGFGVRFPGPAQLHQTRLGRCTILWLGERVKRVGNVRKGRKANWNWFPFFWFSGQKGEVREFSKRKIQI